MDRARVVLAIAVLLAVPAVPGLSGGTAQARVQYDAILEWTGPYFRVKNAPLVDQLTDTPAHDMTFVQPYAVAAREHAAGQRDVVYVVDSGHNRVQLFEVNAQYVSADQSAFTWRQGGATAASEWDSDQIHLAEWAASAEHWVVPYSEVVTINGGAWTRVADLTGFTAADRVYTLDYSDASDAPVLNFPANSLAQTSTIVLRYVTSDNQTGAADAFGLGDVDYGVGAGGTPVLAKIDQTSGGPASWQQLRSIALIADEVTATTDDVFLVDAADNSGAQNQELFEFTVTSAGTVAYVGAYDDVLTTPNDVAVARSGASTAAAAALTGGPGPFTAATVTDAAQVTGHVYDVTVAAGSVTITDETTARVLVSSTLFAKLADPFLGIPGVSLTKAGVVGVSMKVETTRAVPNRYLFVADTGGDRIKVVSAGAGPAIDWPGNWLGGDSHAGMAQPTADGTVGATANQDYRYTTPSPVPEDYSVYTNAFPIKEGTLGTITFDPDGTPEVWTRIANLTTAGPADKVYEVDWSTGRITFGDGTHGQVPPAGVELQFDYTTTPDVLRYGSSGTGNGRFAGPKGVAARWNAGAGAYDVYVADSGNSRIQKFAFHPPTPSLHLPARMDFVCAWDTGVNGTDELSNPVDVAVALDRQDAGSSQTCYVAIADEGNDRVLVYRDAAAASGGGTAVPAFDAVMGEHGDALSLFTQVDGICFVQNGNDLDLYAVDGGRGTVAKYQEMPSPAVSLDFTGASALPRCFPESSSYPFRFTVANPPAGGWIDFYYDTSSTFNISTSKLCITSGAIPATATSAIWSFEDTPDAVPANDPGYYLFARMKDSTGTVVAEDQSDGTELLCVDSTLVPTLRVVDAIDGDRTLLLQNGISRVVDLQIAYPESVIAIGFAGAFDTSLVEITGITPGNVWEGLGGTEAFNPAFNNTAGTFLVSSSVAYARDGLSGSDARTVARISFRARADAITPAARHREALIEILEDGSGITDVHGDSPPVWHRQSMDLRIGYLADLATTGESPDSFPPHLVPHPDGKIDFSDQMLFTIGWNGADNVQDRIADIGPAEGSTPDLVSSPDGRWNLDDVLAFTTMFSWAANLGFSKSGPAVAGDGLLGSPGGLESAEWSEIPGAVQLVPAGRVDGGPVSAGDPIGAGRTITVDLSTAGARDLTGARILVLYSTNELRLTGVEDGGLLRGKDGGLFYSAEGSGLIEIDATRLDRDDPGLDGDGTIATLRFELLRTPSSPLSIGFDLRSSIGNVLARGVRRSGPLAGAPSAVRWLRAQPDPAIGSSDILFSLESPARAVLALFDANGRRVRSLLDAPVPAGIHVVRFDGRGDAGDRLPSGTYFYRLNAAGRNDTGRLVLLR